MTKVSRSLTAALVTTTLSLPLAGLALADSESSPLMLANESTMEHKAEQAGEAVSDTWITTKVKSALLAGDATPGMDIEVETKDGVVSLSGTVATEAQREAAIDKAKTIKGVRDVAADGLKAVE
ncbi:BON domain-containing protein [Stutzerimonas azotifigens]|uniref:BON domain-containing protein n=1 Tax=Stutzerimonas azotifigens TaxID=291995 RepID=UPI00041152A7|nr:BON domain-containing protein [Stutzerimonas azotifigens]